MLYIYICLFFELNTMDNYDYNNKQISFYI